MKEGWEVKKLGEVSVFYNGYTPKETELFDSGIIPYFKVSDMNHPMNKKFLVHTDLFLNESNKIYPRNTIVFPKNGAAIATNKKRILERESVVDLNTGGIGVKDNCLYYLFLYYYLNNIDLKKYTRRGAVPTLDLKELKSLSIYLPPLPEQSRIVEELDLLSNIIEKKRQQLSELDNLAQSIFYDMFGDPVTNEKGWEVKAIKEVAPQKPYKGDVPSINGKYWLLNLDMIVPNTGEIIDKCYFEKEEIGNSTIAFDRTNVLYSKLRPYLNKVVIPNDIGYATMELVPLCPLVNVLNREFLAHLLRSYSFVSYINDKVAGAKMPRVSMDILRAFPVILPPLSLQQLFSQKIEAIEKQKALIKQSITETEELFNSRMDYYFS